MSSDHSFGMLASMRLKTGVGVVIQRIEPFLVACVNSPLKLKVVKDAGAVWQTLPFWNGKDECT